MADQTNVQKYRTQIGLYANGNQNPCAVNLEVATDTFQSGSSRAVLRFSDKDDNPMGALMLSESDMKRLALQLIMDLF